MNEQAHGSDDLTRAVRGIVSGDPREEVESMMDESLRRFREDLSTHPYVRRLERKGRLRPLPVWFIAGRPVLVRWAAAVMSFLIVVAAGLSLKRQLLPPVVWAEVADQMAGIDRMMFSMKVRIVEPESGGPMMSEGLKSRQDILSIPGDERRMGRGAGGEKEETPFRSMDAQAPAKASRPATEEVTMAFWLSQEYGFRWDVLTDSLMVSSMFIPPSGDSMIWVMHEEELWARVPIDPNQSDRSLPDVARNPEEYIRRFLAGGYRELGASVIDGTDVVGIEVDDPPAGSDAVFDGVGRLWVDVSSSLPVKLELSGQIGGRNLEWVFDFRWGEQVDSERFKPVIPPGSSSLPPAE